MWISDSSLTLLGSGIDVERIDRFEAFGVKEALLKALTSPYSFQECEFYFNEHDEMQNLRLSADSCEDCGVVAARSPVLRPPTGECIAAVKVFSTAPVLSPGTL